MTSTLIHFLDVRFRGYINYYTNFSCHKKNGDGISVAKDVCLEQFLVCLDIYSHTLQLLDNPFFDVKMREKLKFPKYPKHSQGKLFKVKYSLHINNNQNPFNPTYSHDMLLKCSFLKHLYTCSGSC